MNIPDFYKTGTPVFSVELIPPRNGENVADVYENVAQLKDSPVSYYSVTHGSGGSLRGGTLAIVHNIMREHGCEAVAHMTCLDASRKEVENRLIDASYLGVNNILALRGDPPWGAESFTADSDGHKYAYQLIEQIMDLNQGRYILRPNDHKFLKLDADATYKPGVPTNFCVGVAGYPEVHAECINEATDTAHLKQKIDAGGQYIITQMIFDVGIYKRYVERVRAAGITVPIIAGVYPTMTLGAIRISEEQFGATVPAEFKDPILKALSKSKKEGKAEAIRQTVRFCRELLDAGAPGIHFYSMNKGEIIRDVLAQLAPAR